MDKKAVTLVELRHLALPRVRDHQGCSGVEDIAIELDQDGEWFIALTASGGTATEDAQRAAAAVRNDLGDWYTIQTD